LVIGPKKFRSYTGQHSREKTDLTSVHRTGFEIAISVFERSTTARQVWSASKLLRFISNPFPPLHQ